MDEVGIAPTTFAEIFSEQAKGATFCMGSQPAEFRQLPLIGFC
jgi:hypothetical protein